MKNHDKLSVGMYCSFGLGGADKCSFNLVKSLTELNYHIKVFYGEHSFPKFMPNEHSKNHIVLSRFDDYKKLDNVELIEVNNVQDFNKHDLDILNTHRSGNDIWLMPSGFDKTKFKFKIVESNFHGNLKTKADVRVFPSNAMVQFKRISNCNHVVIPNPMMVPQSDDNLREELDIGERFVYGRIARPEKNIYSPFNLEAFKQVDNFNNIFLYVSPCSTAYDDAKRLGINNIIFLDPTIDEDRLSKIYNTFDVHCHSNSAGETFGNTIAESMIHGKPCITHKGGKWTQAQPEVIGDGFPELFTTNVKDYADLMRKLQQDKHYYDSVAMYNKTRADAYYDYRKVAETYLKLYESLV